MASLTLYNYFKTIQFNDPIDFDNDTIKLALCSSSYSPDASTHQTYSDLTDEITGSTGYTTGGGRIENFTVTQSNSISGSIIDADDRSFASLTTNNNVKYGIIYKSSGNKKLIGYVTFDDTVGVTNGTLTISWNATGVFTATSTV